MPVIPLWLAEAFLRQRIHSLVFAATAREINNEGVGQVLTPVEHEGGGVSGMVFDLEASAGEEFYSWRGFGGVPMEQANARHGDVLVADVQDDAAIRGEAGLAVVGDGENDVGDAEFGLRAG